MKEQILKLLANSEPMKVGEIAQALNADKKEVEKVLKSRTLELKIFFAKLEACGKSAYFAFRP